MEDKRIKPSFSCTWSTESAPKHTILKAIPVINEYGEALNSIRASLSKLSVILAMDLPYDHPARTEAKRLSDTLYQDDLDFSKMVRLLIDPTNAT